jgi:hypothetical protein
MVVGAIGFTGFSWWTITSPQLPKFTYILFATSGPFLNCSFYPIWIALWRIRKWRWLAQPRLPTVAAQYLIVVRI